MLDERSAGSRWWRWIIGVVSFMTGGCLLVLPFVKHITVAADDVQTLLTPTASMWDALISAWHGPLFRPAVVLSASLVDPVSREAPLVGALQGLGLLLSALAVWVIAAKWTARKGVGGLAVCAWLMHPAVAVSVWQTDTLSQTFSAVAGLWLFALATDAWRPTGRHVWWVVVVACGLLTKETFVGWVPACLFWELLSRGKWEKVHAVALLVVAAYLALRLPIALSSPAQVGNRYALKLDASLFTSGVTLVLGLLTYGPLHLLRLLGWSSALWWLALAGPMCHLLLLVVRRGRSELRSTAQLWATALVVLVPVLPLGHVSELYLMGPNALTALALAQVLPSSQREVSWWSRTAFFAALAGCAIWGVTSRAYHFSLTWQYSGALARQLPTRSFVGPTVNDEQCHLPEKMHSVYFVSPSHALCVPCTAAVAAARGEPLPPQWETRLDCRHLPPRRTW